MELRHDNVQKNTGTHTGPKSKVSENDKPREKRPYNITGSAVLSSDTNATSPYAARNNMEKWMAMFYPLEMSFRIACSIRYTPTAQFQRARR